MNFPLKLIFLLDIFQFCWSKVPLALDKELQRNDIFLDLSNLVIDIIYKIKSRYCYALITDDIYSEAITPKLFEDIKEHQVFVGKIKESEDLLNPSTETYCMLSEIRKAKCDVNVILLANGIQVERLLRYGDKTRVLNTRAKFIMLHDYRLFSQSMHYIWKRIINVVFIRTYDQSHRQGVLNKGGRLFELSTVPFPSPLKEVFVLKRLDFWQAGRYRYGKDLFQDRTADLLGEDFKTVLLEHTPAIKKINLELGFNYTDDDTHPQSNYSGLEINILNALGQVMNFTPIYYELVNAEVEKWGEKNENNTFNGVLGEMDDAKADFALADLYYTSYHLEVLDLSIPYMVECLTFLTPEATTDNSWLTLLLPFSPSMWAGVLASLFSVGFIFYGVSLAYNSLQAAELRKAGKSIGKCDKNDWKVSVKNIFRNSLGKKSTDKPKTPVKIDLTEGLKVDLKEKSQTKMKPVTKDMFDDFSNCIIYTYSMLLYVSLPKFPLNWSLRLLTGWYWIYCILIVVAYRASMTAILSKPIPRVTIDTIKELADSKVGVGMWGQFNKELFLMAQDEASQTVGQRAEQFSDPLEAAGKVSNGDYAFYENEHFLKEVRSKVKSSQQGLSLHVMRECAIQMPISIGLAKNSPLKEKIDKYLRRMIESGLIEKWLTNITMEFESSEEDPPPEAKMDLKKLYAGLVALSIGYTAGIIVLIIEILYWKCHVEKHPLYDKYAVMKFYQEKS